MATKIRLKRTGSRHQPHYRVVVMDSSKSRDGLAIEQIGYYNPRTDPPTIDLDGERALYWLGVGAQPTDTVRSLLEKTGVMKSFRQDSGTE